MAFFQVLPQEQTIAGQFGAGLGKGIQEQLGKFFEEKEHTRQMSRLQDQLRHIEDPSQRMSAIAMFRASPEVKKQLLDAERLRAGQPLLEKLRRGEPMNMEDLIEAHRSNLLPPGAIQAEAQRIRATPFRQRLMDMLAPYPPSPQDQIPPGMHDPAHATEGVTPYFTPAQTPMGEAAIDTIPDNELRSMMLAGGEEAEVAKSILNERQKRKEHADHLAEIGRKETADYRKNLADRRERAESGLRNKELQIDLIKRGNLAHPLVAGFSSYLPRGFDKALLSDDAQLYQSVLIEEFRMLRDIFSGQTRVKEIEILEEKLPTLFHKDAAKEKILMNSMRKAEEDIIRADIAADVERDHPEFGIMQFANEVEKRAKPQLEKLFHEMLDEMWGIAEEYGAVTPEDVRIFKALPDSRSLAEGSRRVHKGTGRKFRIEGGKWREIS